MNSLILDEAQVDNLGHPKSPRSTEEGFVYTNGYIYILMIVNSRSKTQMYLRTGNTILEGCRFFSKEGVKANGGVCSESLGYLLRGYPVSLYFNIYN